jgi:hypothetical protein
VQIETNVAELNASIQEYARLSGKTVQEALKKQASKLGYNLRTELRSLMPAKGSIRAELLERLKSHRGIKIRPKILQKIFGSGGTRTTFGTQRAINTSGSRVTRGRRLNLWAEAIKAEIGARESARGFLGVSASYRGMTGVNAMLESGGAYAVSRLGPTLSTATFKPLPEDVGASIEFEWSLQTSGLSAEAAEGITKQRGEAAVNRALVNTLEDIQVYIERKLQEDWTK